MIGNDRVRRSRLDSATDWTEQLSMYGGISYLEQAGIELDRVDISLQYPSRNPFAMPLYLTTTTTTLTTLTILPSLQRLPATSLHSQAQIHPPNDPPNLNPNPITSPPPKTNTNPRRTAAHIMPPTDGNV